MATPSFAILQEMMLAGIVFNLMLAFFNLLPIPPLDGSHVFKYLLPPALAVRYVQLGRFGFLILLAFLWIGQRWLALWMTPATQLNAFAGSLIAPFLLPTVAP